MKKVISCPIQILDHKASHKEAAGSISNEPPHKSETPVPVETTPLKAYEPEVPSPQPTTPPKPNALTELPPITTPKRVFVIQEPPPNLPKLEEVNEYHMVKVQDELKEEAKGTGLAMESARPLKDVNKEHEEKSTEKQTSGVASPRPEAGDQKKNEEEKKEEEKKEELPEWKVSSFSLTIIAKDASAPRQYVGDHSDDAMDYLRTVWRRYSHDRH